ncbi:MAG: OmpA family protein [Elusimicrobia bacterium]|nr:OmpA family protein [Elusimicrobiota bacterium]
MRPIYLLAALSLLTGCVSTQTYKQLQDDTGRRIAELEKRAAASETRVSELNTGLDQSNAALKQAVDERDKLRGSNQELSKSLSAKQSELAKTVSSLSDKNQALEQKVAYMAKAQEELQAKQERELAQAKGTYEGLVGQLKQEIADGQIKITQIQGKLTVNVADKIFFDSGRAEIKEEGTKVLLRVADVLKQVRDKRISIEGHTDNKPMTAALREKFPTNWELSAARALTVARFLQEKGGVDPTILSAVGYGEYHPVAGNETPEGRGHNRRIEIVLLDKEVGKAAQ